MATLIYLTNEGQIFYSNYQGYVPTVTVLLYIENQTFIDFYPILNVHDNIILISFVK